MERLPSPPCPRGSGERRTLLPTARSACACCVVAVTLLLPASAAAQRDAFVQALIAFRLALAGAYGDEGPEALARLQDMEASLTVWDGTVAAAERDLRAQLPGASPQTALGIHLTLAGQYIERGRLDDALAEVQAAVAIDPTREVFERFQGLIHLALGRPGPAAEAFERAWALDPADPLRAYELADLRLALSSEADVQPQLEVLMAARAEVGAVSEPFIRIELVEDTAADWPVFAPAAYADGFRLIDERRYAEAIAAFRTATERDPLVADPTVRTAPMAAALASLRRNQIRAAIPDLEAAVAASPSSSEAHRLLGVAYNADRRETDGIRQFEEAIRLAPEDERSRIALGKALMRLDRWPDAERALRETIDVLPSSAEARWSLADLYEQTGRGLEAIAELEVARGFSLLAGRGPLLFRLADLYHRHQNFEAVTGILSLRVRLDRNRAPAHKDLGLAYQRRGRPQEALLELLMATLIGPDDPETLTTIGQIHLGARRYAQAETTLQRAVALDPASAQARFALGQTLMRLGRADEARAHLEEYQRLNDVALEQQREAFEFESLVREAERRTGEGRDDVAADLWKSVIALRPDEPSYRVARAGALSRSGDLEGAVAELEQAVTMDAPTSAYRQLASLYAKLGRTEDSEQAQATFERLLQASSPPAPGR